MKYFIRISLIIIVFIIFWIFILVGFGPTTRINYYNYKGKIIKCERVFGWGIGNDSLKETVCYDK